MKLHHRLPKFVFNLKEKLFKIKVPAKLVFLIIGLLSSVWFLVRVIPKPNRANYPCMQAAFPFMSGFVAYILGLMVTVFTFKKSKKNFINARYMSAAVFLCISIFAAIFSFTYDSIPVYANSKYLLGINQPIGVPRGLFPGRVVWAWDSTATNKNCTNVFGDGWFMSQNTDMTIVDQMVSDALLKLTEKSTIADAWDGLFKYFNNNHNKGNIGYQDGEKFFIRTNQVSASSSAYDSTTFEIKDQSRYGMAETSPQVILAILRQLVNVCGIKEESISLGDPMKHMYKHFFDMLHDEFPNVVYLDSDARFGRTAPAQPTEPSIYWILTVAIF